MTRLKNPSTVNRQPSTVNQNSRLPLNLEQP